MPAGLFCGNSTSGPWLAEQLLASSISHDHQLLVRTALKTEIAFDAVADELIAQHGKTHKRENRWSANPGAEHVPGNQPATLRTRSPMAARSSPTTSRRMAMPRRTLAEEEMEILDEEIGYFVEDGVDPDVAEYVAD